MAGDGTVEQEVDEKETHLVCETGIETVSLLLPPEDETSQAVELVAVVSPIVP